MVTRILGMLVVLATLVGTARADSPKLQAAKQAITDLKFDQARRALVEALAEGTHGPAAMREIYALSAEVAVVLGDRALGEQFYQRWLAIDPTAKLPDGSAPKLRDAFVAAQAQMSARGRLALRTERTPAELVVSVASDPLAMVHGVAIEGATRQPAPGKFAVAPAAAPRAYAVDEHGNRLLETEPIAGSAPETPAQPQPQQPATPQKPRTSFAARWTTWAVPAGAFLIAGTVFGTLASVEHNKANDLLDDSPKNFYTDFAKHQARFERYTKYGIVFGGIGVLLAIPATVFYIQNRKPWELGGLKIAPVANQRGGGLAAFGEF